MKNPLVLVIDFSPSTRLGAALRDILTGSSKAEVRLLPRASDASPAPVNAAPAPASPNSADVVFLAFFQASVREVAEAVSQLQEAKTEAPLIIVNEGSAPEEIIEYFRLGIADYVSLPLSAVDILPRMWRQMEHAQTSKTLVHSLKEKLGLKQLIGQSPAFLAVINTIPVIARSDVSVQISGETGTGKELCARAIHYLGPRAGKPFLPVNCGAIPSELVENELFGHVRGAFTGATLSHGGLLGEATGGTLFLDEIDCLPLAAQVKLLRLLQEKEYRQLGSTKTRQADVRVIAATSIDLQKAVHEGSFRQDLFYRLNIVHLCLPPLRERTEDIPVLARHFLTACADELQREAADFTPQAMDALCQYDWPGNVRELENVVKRAVVFAQGRLIEAEGLALPRRETTVPCESFRAEKSRVVAEFEKQYMQGLLRKHHGNISQAARAAQKNRRAFWQLMRKYHIDVEQFRRPSP